MKMPSPKVADAATTADPCTPAPNFFAGYSIIRAIAKAVRGSFTRIRVRPAGNASSTIRHPAAEAAAIATPFLPAAHAKSEAPASYTAAAR